MKNWLMYGLLLLAIVAASVFFVLKPAEQQVDMVDLPDKSTEYTYIEQFKAGPKTFLCKVRVETESSCHLFVSDDSEKSLVDLNLSVDYGYFEKKIVPSPDGTHIALIYEHEVLILDTETLTPKEVFKAPEGSSLGTYDGFPAFIPYVKWDNNEHIQVSIFNGYTPEPFGDEPAAVPSETLVVAIN
jgi:hypothetical protein